MYSGLFGLLSLVSGGLAITACSTPEKEDYTKEKPVQPESKPAEKAPPPKKVITQADLGTCHLTASGAVTADQTTPGGRAATNISYWYSADDQKTMMGVNGFVVNCNGPDIRFSIVPGGGKQDGMPFKAKKYVFDKGKGDANVMTGFGKATMATPSGTIDITAFDSHHIAGTIDLSGKLTPGSGDVKLSGSFDLGCPGFSACEK
jgi:hypothetical protein